ncbi:MAG: CAP domain-containing protein [Proteobacteria bacterium]|nr:CAP domain-containing protein [Pseudomonadota bacterium]
MSGAARGQTLLESPASTVRLRQEAILAEINFARQNPRAYAAELLLQPVSDWEAALGPDPQADADAGAYGEAIEFLQRQAPLPPLSPDDRLTQAALEHVADQGLSGATGHNGALGERFDDRLRRHGAVFGVAAENITYGPAEARDVVRELIIDKGVRDRGHRRNIFLAAVREAGVSCGPHAVYGDMCVIDFADGEATGGGRMVSPWTRPRAGEGPAEAGPVGVLDLRAGATRASTAAPDRVWGGYPATRGGGRAALEPS